jgi:hypothetical protein
MVNAIVEKMVMMYNKFAAIVLKKVDGSVDDVLATFLGIGKRQPIVLSFSDCLP